MFELLTALVLFSQAFEIAPDSIEGVNVIQSTTPLKTEAEKPSFDNKQNVSWKDTLSKAEAEIISRESTFNPNAKNPRSTAFGLGQLVVRNRIAYGKKLGIDPHTTNPHEQIALFREYVKKRYGTAEKALAHHNRKGWY